MTPTPKDVIKIGEAEVQSIYFDGVMVVSLNPGTDFVGHHAAVGESDGAGASKRNSGDTKLLVAISPDEKLEFRQSIRSRNVFSSVEAALKLIWLLLRKEVPSESEIHVCFTARPSPE